MATRRNSFRSPEALAMLDVIEAQLSVPMGISDVMDMTGMSYTTAKDFLHKLIADGRIKQDGYMTVRTGTKIARKKIYVSCNPSPTQYAPISANDPESMMEVMIRAQHDKFMSGFVPKPDWSFAWLFDRNQYPAEQEVS